MPQQKKKTAKRAPSRLPATKRFEVSAISRGEIASLLNAAIAGCKAKVKRFRPDDPRLTDKLCEAFAWSVNDQLSLDGDEDVEEAQRDVAVDTIEEFEDALDS